MSVLLDCSLWARSSIAYLHHEQEIGILEQRGSSVIGV